MNLLGKRSEGAVNFGKLAPWKFRRLPNGLTTRDFQNARQALAAGGGHGRLRPPNTGRTATPLWRFIALYGTDIPQNRKRFAKLVKTAPMDWPTTLGQAPYPTLPGLHPCVLWRDPSPRNGGGRPVAVISEAGYLGSVWPNSGQALWTRVRKAASEGFLITSLVMPEEVTRAGDGPLARPIRRLVMVALPRN